MKITEVDAGHVLDQLQGATIVSHFIEDDQGLHIVMQDGRILVVAGFFAISILKAAAERLH